MEPYTHYLMWMRTHDVVMSSSNDNFINSSSWEEEALADGEATGNVLGGFVWPPRSYICSFCKREFRSAQALGGHMNVHRRDRAKVTQSLIISPLTTNALHHDQNHHTSSTTSFTAPPAPPYSFHFSPPFSVSRNKKEPILPNHEVNCLVDKKLSFDIDSNEDIIRCKRQKKTAFSLSKDNLSKNPCLISDKHGLQSEKLESNEQVGPIMEEIDLELRLGHPSAVK